MLDRLQQVANRAAVGGDLEFHWALLVKINDSICHTISIEGVLVDVFGKAKPSGTDRFTFGVSDVCRGASGAVRGVLGEGFHDVEFIVFGLPGAGSRIGREAHMTSRSARHGG